MAHLPLRRHARDRDEADTDPTATMHPSRDLHRWLCRAQLVRQVREGLRPDVQCRTHPHCAAHCCGRNPAGLVRLRDTRPLQGESFGVANCGRFRGTRVPRQ